MPTVEQNTTNADGGKREAYIAELKANPTLRDRVERELKADKQYMRLAALYEEIGGVKVNSETQPLLENIAGYYTTTPSYYAGKARNYYILELEDVLKNTRRYIYPRGSAGTLDTEIMRGIELAEKVGNHNAVATLAERGIKNAKKNPHKVGREGSGRYSYTFWSGVPESRINEYLAKLGRTEEGRAREIAHFLRTSDPGVPATMKSSEPSMKDVVPVPGG